ncbi:MAG: alpha/beta hydrolase [Hydrogenophilaceae bacterium]|jgi:hypothetical protein|nr:alpha/beta hydrolase [Hydrogenophilaceae bacterium]
MIIRVLIGAAIVYVAICAAAFVLQRNLLYFPSTDIVPPPAGIDSLRLDTPDGERLVAWFAPPQDEAAPIHLFFDGNGGAPQSNLARWAAIRETGAGFLAVYYRGYSGSTGAPTEAGLHADARTGYDWLAARYAAQRIVIHGFSLGSAVAVRLARDVPARALVLEAPFTAVVDVAQSLYPLLPAHLLVRDQFRSRDWIADVAAPVLIVHGEADDQIPIRYGERLFALAREPKRFIRVPNAGHDDLVAHGLYAHVQAFLNGPR